MKCTTDYQLLRVDEIKNVYCYPTIVDGFEVWNTDWYEGPHDRYSDWGPFAKLVQLLEGLNVMDNKIAVEYANGVFVGFYDGKVRVGTSQRYLFDNPAHQKIYSKKDLLKRERVMPHRFR